MKYEVRMKNGDMFVMDEVLITKLLSRLRDSGTSWFDTKDGLIIILSNNSISSIKKIKSSKMEITNKPTKEEVKQLDGLKQKEVSWGDLSPAEKKEIRGEKNTNTTAKPDCEKYHDSLSTLGMTTTTKGIKRYFPYCPDCGYQGRLIRHAEVSEDAVIVDLDGTEG